MDDLYSVPCLRRPGCFCRSKPVLMLRVNVKHFQRRERPDIYDPERKN